MNILIPIAGQDKLFKAEDYAFPKPLIDVAGKPVIEHAVSYLKKLLPDARFTFVVKEELCRLYSMEGVLQQITHGHRCDIIKLQSTTQGAVCSLLMAIDAIDENEELIIANSDQVITAPVSPIIESFRKRGLDAGVITFESSHPRWSYVRLDEAGDIIETTEKRVISNVAIAGLHYFKKGSDFIACAKQVLLNGTTVQGAYYVSQVINEMILLGKKVSHSHIDSSDYFNLYSPQKMGEYEQFIRGGKSRPQSAKPVLLIPAAGEGSRFAKAGYSKPKPFIDVDGKPMILRVLENLAFGNMRSVVVARQSHLDAEPDMNKWFAAHGIKLVTTSGLTEGTACTVLLAAQHIDPEAPLIIANSDQIVDFDIQAYVDDCLQRGLDGSILCFPEPGRSPKWSYAKLDDAGLVTEVKEKVAISDLATVGIYLFTKGKYFIESAITMIANNERVNNEFYTCPVYNYAIKEGRKIGVYTINANAMHGIGTPEDLDAYLPMLKKGAA